MLLFALKPEYKPVQEVHSHDHSCMFFNSNLEFFHCAVPFIRTGIQNNEKCMVVIDELTKEDVYRNFSSIFREGFIPPEEFSNHKNIVIEHCENIYLVDGYFDMDRTIASYKKACKETIEEGYTGLRVIAEFSKTIWERINFEKLVSYEDKVDEIFSSSNLIAICSYNKKYFSPQHIKKVNKVHPIEVDLLKTRL